MRNMSAASQLPRARKGAHAPAYTLTEMLVVLVIIGLLAAIVGPRLFSRLDDAKKRTARVQIASLETAIDLFQLDIGRLPTDEEGLQALVLAPADASAWLGPYLARDELPSDPWGNSYVYVLEADGERFRVMSFGADGREGGEGAAEDLIGQLHGVSRSAALPAVGDMTMREP